MSDEILNKPPGRWDVPFWKELPDPQQRLPMDDSIVARLMNEQLLAGMKESNFPASTPLDGILRNDTRLRKFKNGDVVLRKGDYGESAFLVLNGSVGVVQAGLEDAESTDANRSKKSKWQSFLGTVWNPKSPELRDITAYPQAGESNQAKAQQLLVQDIPGVLQVPSDRLSQAIMVTIFAGSMFGELAALGRIPRTATVVALEDTELLEIRWQGLRDLRRYDDALRNITDENYREYGLRTILSQCELFEHIEDSEKLLEIIDEVAKPEHSRFQTYGSFDWYGTYKELRELDADPMIKEPVIAAEGTAVVGLILIRAGFGRLSKQYGNGEITFDYLGKGRTYGLRELIQETKSSHRRIPLQSTLRAVGYVDIVRITTACFENIILPHLSDEVCEKLVQSSRSIAEPGDEENLAEFLLENRFINAKSAMIIDLDRCTNCDDCVRACASGHDNNPRFIRHGSRHLNHMVTNACMHCADPVCMIGCPTGAIHHAPEGEVVINDLTCIGCETCARNCPYDNIRMVNIRDRKNNAQLVLPVGGQKPIQKATKCDLCVEHAGGPACVRACPHDALFRLDLTRKENLPQWLTR